MGLGLRRRVWALAFLALGAVAQPAAASHFRYGTLSWAPILDANGQPTGEVEFRLIVSVRRDFYGSPLTGAIVELGPGPTALDFGDGSATQPLFVRILSQSATENWILGEALNPGTTDAGIRHIYSSAGPFDAYLAGNAPGAPFPPPIIFPACCRIDDPSNPAADETLENRGGLPYPLHTVVFPLSGNSSPVSTMVPIVVVPSSSAATFQIPAVDPDDDPITWRPSTNAEAVGTNSAPATDPNPPPGFTFNGATGLVTWNNIGLAEAPTFWTAQFVIEDHEGSLTGPVKSKTPVDFLLQIRPQVASLPSCAINPAGPHTVAPGTPLTFAVTGADLDGDVTLNTGGIPSGAFLLPAVPLTGASPLTVFSWTPSEADVGGHAVIFSATDTDGQQALCQTTIQVVVGAPSCSINPAGPHTVAPGSPLAFTVTGTDPDAGDSITLDVGGTGLPPGATMNPTLPLSGGAGVSSTFDWTPTAADAGSRFVTFSVTDSANHTAQCVTRVLVAAANPAPSCAITPPGPQTVQAGTPVAFTVEGADPDPLDTLTLELTSGPLPAGATLSPDLTSASITGPSPLSSQFDWTPAATQAGARTFSFLVTDSAGQRSSCDTTVTVEVVANNPPVCRIDFLSGPGGLGDGDDDDGDDEDDDGEKDDEDDDRDGDRDHDRDRDRDGDRDRHRAGRHNVKELRLLADRDGDDRDGEGGDSKDNDDDDEDDDEDDQDDQDDDGEDGSGVPAGRLVAFRVTGTDPDAGDILTLIGTVPSGTTMTPPLPLVGSSPVISEGLWTPNLSQVGPQIFSFTVTDIAGLQGFCVATVEVVQRPPRCEIEFPDDRDGGDDEDRDDDGDKDRDGDRDDGRNGDDDHDGSSHRSEERHVADRDAARETDRDRDDGDRDEDDDHDGRGKAKVGRRVTFRVTATDPDVGDIITLTSGPLPAGATMDPTLPLSGSSPLRSQFRWTPTQDQLGSHVITFTVTDLAGEQGVCRARIDVERRRPRCPNGDDDEDGDEDRDKDRERDDDRSGDRDRRHDRDRHRDNNDDEGCKPEDEDRDRDDEDRDRDEDRDGRDPDREH